MTWQLKCLVGEAAFFFGQRWCCQFGILEETKRSSVCRRPKMEKSAKTFSLSSSPLCLLQDSRNADLDFFLRQVRKNCEKKPTKTSELFGILEGMSSYFVVLASLFTIASWLHFADLATLARCRNAETFGLFEMFEICLIFTLVLHRRGKGYVWSGQT